MNEERKGETKMATTKRYEITVYAIQEVDPVNGTWKEVPVRPPYKTADIKDAEQTVNYERQRAEETEATPSSRAAAAQDGIPRIARIEVRYGTPEAFANKRTEHVTDLCWTNPLVEQLGRVTIARLTLKNIGDSVVGRMTSALHMMHSFIDDAQRLYEGAERISQVDVDPATGDNVIAAMEDIYHHEIQMRRAIADLLSNAMSKLETYDNAYARAEGARRDYNDARRQLAELGFPGPAAADAGAVFDNAEVAAQEAEAAAEKA